MQGCAREAIRQEAMSERVNANDAIGIRQFKLVVDANDSSLLLDALRALAAQLVCVGHGCNLFLGAGTTYLPYVGVMLFFVLSGFVIAHTLERHSSRAGYGFGDFVIDRFARIYSAYLPALVLIVAFDLLLSYFGLGPSPAESSWRVWWHNLLMLQGYVGPWADGTSTYGSAGQLSSLATEWHIYLLIGAIYFLLRGRNRWICLLVAVLVAPQPLAYFSALPDTDRSLFVLWLLGFAAYYVARSTQIDSTLTVLAQLAAPLLTWLWFKERIPGNEYLIDHYPLFALAFLAWVLASQGCHLMRSCRPVKAMIHGAAGFAFSLFLVHYTLEKTVLALWPDGGIFALALALIVSNLLAWVFAYATEAHYRKLATWLRQRLFLRSPKVDSLMESPKK